MKKRETLFEYIGYCFNLRVLNNKISCYGFVDIDIDIWIVCWIK